MYVFSFSPSATPFCVVNANPSAPSPSSPTLMEDQRERVADASLAFVRRHLLRRLALSLVVLASLHHLSPLHLPPSREGKEDRRPLKWTQNGQKGPASSTPSSARRRRRSHRRRQSARLRRSRRRRRYQRRQSVRLRQSRRRRRHQRRQARVVVNYHVTGFPRSIGHFEVVESHHFARRGPPPRLRRLDEMPFLQCSLRL
jgi:hypothetical protein